MKHLSVLVLFSSAVLLALVPTSAFAVDGVVLINQSTVTSGLPGCPTGGHFPIIICDTGSYRLSGDLTVSGGAIGILILADNVTLDLNGFSILGPNTCTGFPVTSCTTITGNGVHTTAHNITVRNGAVVGMYFGVVLDNGGLVENVQTSGNSIDGIYVGPYGQVRNSSAQANGLYGIYVEGVAQGNVAAGNRYDGFYLVEGTATGNTTVANGRYGMIILNGTYGSNSLESNTLGAIDPGGAGATSQNNNNCDGSGC